MVQPWVLHWVKLWLMHFYAITKCPEEFKPVFYRRYVDDIFELFRKEEHLKLFVNYFNLCHENIKFTSEKVINSKLSFLDIDKTRQSQDKNQFITSVYCKPTFSGVFSHFGSFTSRGYKFNLALTLIFCCYSICCSIELFHNEIMQLNKIFEKNGYDNKFFDRCLQTFLNKIYSKKVIQHTVPKKDLLLQVSV